MGGRGPLPFVVVTEAFGCLGCACDPCLVLVDEGVLEVGPADGLLGGEGGWVGG